MYSSIRPYLESSALGAAQNCVGGSDGSTCGTKWYEDGWDGTTGVGQQMCALETFQALLVQASSGPLTNKTGGTSAGNPEAGSNTNTDGYYNGMTRKITTGDRVAAAFVTIALLGTTLAGGWFLVTS